MYLKRLIELDLHKAGRMTDKQGSGLPAINFAAAGGVDLDRLERSLRLQVEHKGYGRYLVSGGNDAHWVDLFTSWHPRCDCGDHLWRERICKHILAALLREGHERVIRELGTLFVRVKDKAA